MATESPIALVVVHGIGSQIRGATRTKLLAGLELAYGSLAQTEEGEAVCVQLGSRSVRIYEVWWADLLGGERVEGTFSVWALQTIAWFPWMNWRARVAPVPPVRMLLWTLLFAPLAIFLQLFWVAAMSIAAGRTKRMLDEKVADVLNYADAADRAKPDDWPLAGVAGEIQERFAATLALAVEDGADEIHVIAHSLGSVIAYRGLRAGPADRVSTLYTIGSPLEKFGLLWPGVLGAESVRPHPARWENFHDWFDPVASRIRRLASRDEVCNHAIFGRANFATAHTSYERDATFLRVLSERLTGTPVQIEVPVGTRIWHLLQSLAISALLLAALVVAVVAGALWATVVILVALFVYVALSLFTDLETISRAMANDISLIDVLKYAYLAGIAIIVALGLTYGRGKARVHHYWHRFHAAPDLSSFDSDSYSLGPGHRAVLWTGTAVAAVAGGVGTTAELDGLPWEAGNSVALGIVELVWFGACFAGIGALALAGLLYAHVMWRQWRLATGRPPSALEAVAEPAPGGDAALDHVDHL